MYAIRSYYAFVLRKKGHIRPGPFLFSLFQQKGQKAGEGLVQFIPFPDQFCHQGIRLGGLPLFKIGVGETEFGFQSGRPVGRRGNRGEKGNSYNFV